MTLIPVEWEEPVILDTTLREGFQTPGGIGASLEERIAAASHIQNYAHWVELGMPANDVDYRIIQAIKERFKEEGYGVGIAVLGRLHDKDIERSAEVMSDYHSSLMHLFIGTSKAHRQTRFGGNLSEKGYEEMIAKYAEKAASMPEFGRIMFAPEDSFRTFEEDPEAFLRFLDAAVEGYRSGNKKIGRAAKPVINLPDTTGKSTVMEFDRVIQHAKERYGDRVELSIHGHNDSGTSQGQALDVYQRRGVRWLQTTFGQLGERNGIASTDLTVKVLVERGYLQDPRIASAENLKALDPTTRTVLALLGRELPEEHLERLNVSTSGIHTNVARRNPEAYHIRSGTYGSQPRLELGPTSGSDQVKSVLDAHGIAYDKSDKKKVEEFTNMLKNLSNERKSPISETQIVYEGRRYFEGRTMDDMLRVEDYVIQTRMDGSTQIRIEGYIGDRYFDRVHQSKGPVEAAMEVLNNIINEEKGKGDSISLEAYRARVIPKPGREYTQWERGKRPKLLEGVGKDADLAISLTFRNGTGNYQGWFRHENSTVAEVGAIIDGMTKMYALQEWAQTPI